MASAPQKEEHHGRSLLSISNATFTVNVKDKFKRPIGTKQIIKKVSLDVKSGETLAIMGPSGAGKTTMLDLLTLEGAGGQRTGSVTLNGTPMTTSMFQKYCAYVPQFDAGWAYLTCKESMQYAADFYMPKENAKGRQDRVAELLKYMGLEVCQNTIVGHEFLKGLSGGQRRRLSLGISFLKDPLVVFLDEVTTGLDAASAANIATFMQEVCVQKDVVIVCTIHQPSATVFKGFKRLLLLSQGQTAYAGKIDDLAGHFAAISHPIPHDENPADFVLMVVNADFTAKDQVDEVIAAWSKVLHRQVSGSSSVAVLDAKPLSHNLFMQFVILYRRGLQVSYRDPLVYLARIVAFMFMCCFFALVYIDTRTRNQAELLSRCWLHCWFVGVPCQMSIVCTLVQNLEWRIIQKEVKQGMYSCFSYTVANTLVQAPYIFILSAACIGPAGYGIANWNGNAFPKNVLLHFLLLLNYESFAQWGGVLFGHPLVGMLMLVCYWFGGFLFGGFLVAEEDVPWPLRAYLYVNPMKFSIRSQIYNELSGDDVIIEGAFLTGNLTDPNDFECYEPEPAPCWGYYGWQALERLGQNAFASVGNDDTFLVDAVVILGITLLWKLCFYITISVKARGRQPVKPEAGSNPPPQPVLSS